MAKGNQVARRNSGSVSKRRHSTLSGLGAVARSLAGSNPYVKAGLNAYSAYQKYSPAVKKAASIISNLSKGSRRASVLSSSRSSMSLGSSAGRPSYKAPSQRWKGTSTGKSRGNFAKPKAVTKSTEAYCLSKGFYFVDETWGRMEDAHTVYIFHSPFQAYMIAKSIVAATIRNVMKQAGIQIGNSNIEVPWILVDQSSAMRLTYQTQNASSGVINTVTYDVPNNSTFLNIVTGFTAYFQHIFNYICDQDPDEPYRLFIQMSTNNFDHYIRGMLNLGDCHLEVFTHSKLVIQNRSAGSQAAADNTDRYALDRVDNVPLIGYNYEFKHTDPRLKQMSTNATGDANLNIADTRGLNLIKASTLFPDWSEPPTPKVWQNCSKAAKIGLEPGDMKTTTLSYNYSGKFANVMKKLRVQNFENPDQIAGVLGRSQIIALEEKIRTDSANPITIQYEKESRVGAVVRKSKMPTLTAPLNTSERNSV